MMGFLEIPGKFRTIIPSVRISLSVTALIFLITTVINVTLDSLYYLLVVIIILVAEIFYLNSLYYTLAIDEHDGDEKDI